MLLDIALGVFGAITFSKIENINLSLILIIIGILFALLPDMDFIFYWMGGKKLNEQAHTHRELLHSPWIFIPVGFLIILSINTPLAFLFVILAFLHFVHDSIGIGWGIQWFYPFSHRFYKLFSTKDGKFSKRLAVSWTPKEQKIAAEKYGDKNWIKNTYFKLTPISAIESLIFIISLIFLALNLK
ncbi:MAG: metal-dependent hydrolase [bacterium]|nr:metal-dependent hydrolase [bacterium]